MYEKEENMRKRIYEIIEVADDDDKLSNIYDTFMLIVIILSLIPLAFKQSYFIFQIMDKISVTIFIIDYLMRWITADYKFNRHQVISFVRYPFSIMAIIDMVSILPSLTLINASFKALRVLRLIRTLRIFRVFKVIRYSKNIQMMRNVLKKSKGGLLTVSSLAVGYIFVSALVIINVEPESFRNYFDALYWATVSLTTMGYGDIYPVTTIGRLVTMFSSFIGIAIVALPAGIITAGYMSEVEDKQNKSDKNDEVGYLYTSNDNAESY